jgi:hypothetical protein
VRRRKAEGGVTVLKVEGCGGRNGDIILELAVEMLKVKVPEREG